MQQYKQWQIFLFSSLLTCCRYVATPGLASSARNIVHCLKPNCLGTRPQSSIPLCVRTYYVCERNLSKEEAHGGPGRPGTCNPRTSGTCSAKREGATRAHPEKWKMKAKKNFRASRGLISTTHLYALPPAAFNIWCPPFINPVSAPDKLWGR